MERRSFIQGLVATVIGTASTSKSKGAANRPTPKSPKRGPLESGERVHIADKMPTHMEHFEHGRNGTVQYSCHQMYRSRDFKSMPLVGGIDENEYSVCIDGYGPVAWYPGTLLTRI